MPTAVQLLDSFAALADSTRCRVLWLLDRQELTVSELCSVLQLPQSTVSRHLKTLGDGQWVSSRRDGTSRYYSLSTAARDGASARVWELTRDELNGRPAAEQDERRLSQVLQRRGETSREFFASAAGQWDRLRDELFGSGFAMQALIGLLPHEWTIGDLGCGTGALAGLVAPHVRRVVGVDGSEEMLAAAKARLASFSNVDLRHGPLDKLPLQDRLLDAAAMMLVLHHLPSPAAAVTEAARVLKPGGRLLIVDMAPHDREEYRQQMGHVWLGFSDEQTCRLLTQAGFDDIRVRPLPPVADAKGPSLFAATATRT